MAQGHFIAIEGSNGVGKTTLCRNLQMLNFDAVFVKEPSKSPLGENLSRIIRDSGKVPPPWTQPQFLLDRMILVRDVIIPELEKGNTVITDRWAISSILYARDHGSLGSHSANLWAIQKSVMDLSPCLSIVLYADIDVLSSRKPDVDKRDIESLSEAYSRPQDLPAWAIGGKCRHLQNNAHEKETAYFVADLISALECVH